MGTDTYIRLIDPKYYSDIEEAFREFEAAGVGFTVVPRRSASNPTGEVPMTQRGLFKFAKEFECVDVSSTQLRAA